MLKRWRNLPRAGVGLLGLALVLMFTVTADAGSGRDGMRRLGSAPNAVLWGVPAGANPANSPAVTVLPTVQEFSIAGSTSMNFLADETAVCGAIGLSCTSGPGNCQCVQATGTVSDGVGPIFQGTAVFTLNIDTDVAVTPSHAYPNGSPAPGACFFASGILSIGTNASIINFVTSGAACNAIGGGVALYSGGFDIGTSTGGFSSAVGGGEIGFGSNFNTGIGIFDLKGAGTNLN